MPDFKLSVCMITYNQERYIAQAVESVLVQQTEFPFEIIIGEDCSTDRTPAILADLQREHPDRIRVCRRVRNLGMMANFAETFGECRGEYLAMLEGDDYWTDPSKLQQQVNALDAHPEWTIAFHRTRCVYEDGSRRDFLFPDSVPNHALTVDDILRQNFIQTCSVVYRHSVVEKLPDWLLQLQLGDWPLHILHADRGEIGFLPQEMAVYRIHRQGVWSLAGEVNRYRATLRMVAAIDDHFGGRYHRQLAATRRHLRIGLLVARCRRALTWPLRALANRRSSSGGPASC